MAEGNNQHRRSHWSLIVAVVGVVLSTGYTVWTKLEVYDLALDNLSDQLARVEAKLLAEHEKVERLNEAWLMSDSNAHVSIGEAIADLGIHLGGVESRFDVLSQNIDGINDKLYDLNRDVGEHDREHVLREGKEWLGIQ